MLRDGLESVRKQRDIYNRSRQAASPPSHLDARHNSAGNPGRNGSIIGRSQVGNTVTVPTLKIVIPLRPDQIPPGLVPAEPAPVGAPVLNVQLAGTGMTIPVHLSGKNARKTLKLLAQHGAANVNLVVNGTLKPGPQAGTWMVAEASFQTFIKPPAAPGRVRTSPGLVLPIPLPTPRPTCRSRRSRSPRNTRDNLVIATPVAMVATIWPDPRTHTGEYPTPVPYLGAISRTLYGTQ